MSGKRFFAPQADWAPADLRGLSALLADGVVEGSSLVEQLHQTILRLSPPVGRPASGTTRGITGLVYRSIRGIATLAGGGAGLALQQFAPAIPGGRVNRDQWVSVLNGVMGEYLDERDNPLAITMRLSLAGQPVDWQQGLVGPQLSAARRRVLVSLHGLCMNESCWFSDWAEQNLPLALAESHGFTPIFVRYNTGRHISDNGAELADYLDRLRQIWPVALDEIVLLGHSMGGLVARSACHHAERVALPWLNDLSAIVTLGSPHHGAPLERIGVQAHRLLGLSPYSAPFARLGRLRSAGITDLRFGNVCPEDWQGQDRFHPNPDARQPAPLVDHVRAFAVAATLDRRADSLRSRTLGDGLVPVASALGQHRRPELCWPVPAHQQQVFCRSGHVDLIHQLRVLSRVRDWL
ncbi:MAG: lipase family alpha/beta hydrolase [Wenzhouxiangella sp.]